MSTGPVQRRQVYAPRHHAGHGGWEALDGSDQDEDRRFQIPEDCHWVDVRAKPTNVGAALQHALRGIEKANPDTLYGVFGDAHWTNKERLSDALLKDLIEHFPRSRWATTVVDQAKLLPMD